MSIHTYKVELSLLAKKEYKKHIKAKNFILIEKINYLKNELKIDPYNGAGNPERLKYKKRNVWSRKISKFHRMVYEIDKMEVTITALWGHYGDK